MTDGAVIPPRIRVRATAPESGPAMTPPRIRVRPDRVMEPETMDTPVERYQKHAPGREPRRAGAVGAHWSDVAGTEYDLFETGATSNYSHGGVAIGSPGGGKIRGFYHKDTDKGRIALYILMRDGTVRFQKWITGTSVDAMQEISRLFLLSREGLHDPREADKPVRARRR